MDSETLTLLDVRDLCVDFGSADQPLRAVDGISFSLPPHKTLALVGESGCGKSVTALSLARLLSPAQVSYPRGSIHLLGKEVLSLGDRQLRDIRGREIAFVFQDPGSSLNPVVRVGDQMLEMLRAHAPDRCNDAEVCRLLELVGIRDTPRVKRAFPFQLSGGMQQRAAIAMAIASAPQLLVADEPTTALDVTVQDQVIQLLKSLQQQLGMAILLITHNLGLVAEIAHRVCVMYAGQIVEEGPTEEILTKPRHPYTRALLDAVPRLEGIQSSLKGIDGRVPAIGAMPIGCRFQPRCPMAQEFCRCNHPPVVRSGDRSVACHFPL